MTYKAVLLDFYGTLVVGDESILHDITWQVAAASPLRPTQAQVMQRWWELMSRMCHAAYGRSFRLQREIELDSLRTVIEEMRSNLDAQVLVRTIFNNWQSPQAYRDAISFLQHLQLPVCVVSNIDEADLQSAIAAQNWELPFAVTSEACRAYKPRPEMFATALRRLRLEPCDVLHVGDSASSDVAGAQALSIDVAWINRHNRPAPLPAPTYAVSDLQKLTVVLEQT